MYPSGFNSRNLSPVIPVNVAPRLGHNHEYSEEEWNDQKENIRSLYLVQDKPWYRVVAILGSEHDFHITRRQFFRRNSKWGFFKYVRGQGRRAAVHAVRNGHFRNLPEIPAEIEEFEDDGEDDIEMQDILSSLVDLGEVTGLREIPLFSAPSQVPNTNSLPEVPSAALIPFTPLRQERRCRPIHIVDNDLSKTKWAEISLGAISQLFDDSQIEYPIEKLSEALQKSNLIENPTYFSAAELREIYSVTNEENTEAPGTNEMATYSPPDTQMVQLSEEPIESKILEAILRTAWTSSGMVREISPFPASPATGETHSLTFQGSISPGGLTSLELELIESKEKVRILKDILPWDNPGLLGTMRILGNKYWSCGRRREAENLFRQVAVLRYKRYGLRHIDTLQALLDVIGIIVGSRETISVLDLMRHLQRTVDDLVKPTDGLAMRCRRLMAKVLQWSGDFEQSAKLRREQLQISLSTKGLKGRDTPLAMESLVYSLNDDDQLAQAEELQRTAIQLQLDRSDAVDFNDSLLQLTQTLIRQERYGESYEVANNALSSMKSSLGDTHPITLQCLSLVGQILHRQGRLQESESFLRKALEQQIKVHAENDVDMIRTRDSLADLLQESHRDGEALTYYQDVLRSEIGRCGLVHPNPAESCWRLAQCYMRLGRYPEALATLEGFLRQLLAEVPEDHSLVAEIRDHFETLQDFVQSQDESQSSEEYSSGEEQFSSSEEGYPSSGEQGVLDEE